jgi:hypothetical protein
MDLHAGIVMDVKNKQLLWNYMWVL